MESKTRRHDLVRAPHPVATLTRAGEIAHTDEGDGPALLALHGGMGGADQSWLLGRALFGATPDLRILGVARPGYPGTALGLGETPEEQADLYVALLDALGIERAHVAAVSAGGPSALQFALRHPQRCAGVVLVSAATGQLAADHVLHRLNGMQRLLRIPGANWLLGRIAGRDPEASARRGIRDPGLLERTLNHAEAGPLIRGLGAMSATQMKQRLPGTFNDTQRYRELARFPFEALQMPLLVLHGTADRVVSFSHAAAAATAPRARLVSLEDGDHVALFTNLDEVREAVNAFLA